MMRKIYLYIMICVVLPTFMHSCTDEAYYGGECVPALTAHYLAADRNQLEFYGDTPDPAQLNIMATNTPWQITGMDSWLKTSQTSGNTDATVTFTAEADTMAGQRISVFALESTTPDYPFTYPISAVQYRRAGFLFLPSHYVYVSATGGTETMEMVTNVENIEVKNEGYDWITATVNGKQLTVTATANPTKAERNGSFLLSYSYTDAGGFTYGNTVAVYVVQAAPGVTTTDWSLQFDNIASSVKVKIKAEAAWTAQTSRSWISVSPSEGQAGETELTVSVTENGGEYSREGSVWLFIDETLKLDISVYQEGIHIWFEGAYPRMESMAGNYSTTLHTNLSSWNIIKHSDWLTATPESGGRGEHKFTVTATDNPNTTSREGEIIVGNAMLNITDTMFVSQKGKMFDDMAGVLQFDNKAASQTMDIITDGAWTAKPENDWITVSPASGSGKSTVTVTVTENMSDDDRTGAVSVTVGATTKTAMVSQRGRYFTVDQGDVFVQPSTGGHVQIYVGTNIAWTATVKNSSDWIKLSATSGQDNGTIDVTMADNPSVDERADTIIITPEDNGQAIRVPVRQAGRYLTVSAGRVAFFYKGGKADPVTVSTDGTYRVEKQLDATWLTLTNQDNTITIEASPYTGDSMRSAVLSVYVTGLKGDLTEAKMAEIEVVQYHEGSQFELSGYGSDKPFEIIFRDGGVIVLGGYDTDKDLEDNGSNKAQIGLDGYGTDKSYE